MTVLLVVLGIPVTIVLAATVFVLVSDAGSAPSAALIAEVPEEGFISTAIEYRVWIEPAPAYGAAQANANRFAIQSALSEWAAVGADIREVSNPNEATILVQFIKEWGTEVAGQTYSESFIQVGLGNSACNGKWTPFAVESVQYIAIHELGHAMGLGHSSDPDSVMYYTFEPKYADACEIGQNDFSLQAGHFGGVNFDTFVPGVVEYSARDLDAGSFHVCIMTPQDYEVWSSGSASRGWGCHTSVNSASDGSQLPAGQYVLAFYCNNYFDNCIIDYRIAIRF